VRILLVTSRYPWPPRRGDQLRALQVAEFLAAEHEVTLLAPAPRPGEGDEAGEQAAAFRVATYRRRWWAPLAGGILALVRGLPWQSVLFYQPDLGRELRRRSPRVDLVVLQLVRLAPHLADVGPAPLAVDLIDCLSLNFRRRARFDRAWLRPVVALEAGRVARWERRLIARARLALVVSDRDRAALAQRLDAAAAARVAVVPIARPAAAGGAGEAGDSRAGRDPAAGERTAAPAEARAPTLVFTGNLGYFPNADAVRWWLRRIWPALGPLRLRFPGLRVVVAGDRPRRAVRRAIRRAGAAGAKVELIESPPDLRAVLAGATVAIAPLRAGSGVPIKVLEAWAAGVPVVASRWAAEGTTGRPGGDLLVAETAAEWGAALAALLADPAARRRFAAAARSRLAAEYGPAKVANRLLDLIRQKV
jgi:glycosyltransferase involved in cell wall biosynthesis